MDICNNKEDMNIVIVGHVDHGKSTIIGRLLADTDTLPQGKIEQIKDVCKRNSKPFEYAFLLDALKEEQKQGITIDAARCFFKTKKRNYIIIDAPGHLEFLKNMISGAARAEAAILVIDAHEGIKENTKRHAYMLSMLGIKQISVVVNKMDLVDYKKNIYEEIVNQLNIFLDMINVSVKTFIPVSGMKGDNIASYSENMKWYEGKTVLETLDNFKSEEKAAEKAFRMPVQGVYKFTQNEDTRRIIAGTPLSGKLKVNDEVIFYPSGKKSKVKTIETFNRESKGLIESGYASGFTLEEQIYVTRGEIVAKVNEPKPCITTSIKVNLFWLGNDPMEKAKSYILKLGTCKVNVQIEQIISILDASNLKKKQKDVIEKNDVAECILKLTNPIAFDVAESNFLTSRFVIVNNNVVSGGGLIVEALDDKQTWIRENTFIRDNKWEKSEVTQQQRAEKYSQKPTLIVITGKKDIGKKGIAKRLEKQLIDDGKFAYFLGFGNVLYGVNADIRENVTNKKDECLRRLAEVSNIMLDAGMILIVTAIELTKNDLDTIKSTVNFNNIITIWVGENVTTDIPYNLIISSADSVKSAVDKIKILLQSHGIIFKCF